MKPYVIVHMATSLDGRTLPSRWSPSRDNATSHYERVHDTLAGQAWLVGRTTGRELAKGAAYPAEAAASFPRTSWLPKLGARGYGVVLDRHGTIAWGRADIGGDPVVVVLGERASDAHLAGLRADGVSYVFAGEHDLDIPLALETLNRELGVERLLVEGGGITNGALLRAGLVDEISLLVYPTIDGAPGAPSLFEATDATARATAVRDIERTSSEALDDGVVWLRYRVHNR